MPSFMGGPMGRMPKSRAQAQQEMDAYKSMVTGMHRGMVKAGDYLIDNVGGKINRAKNAVKRKFK